ncbi:MAG: hypothetical protein Q4G69_00905 [Planctomycetia bacterium]|nr:hypothetical protein [Planctomycetia bacterium]
MRHSLRQLIPSDVFDYVQLTSALNGYANIRGKIGRLIASGEIIRIKKGFYTFPDYLRRAPLNSCMIANMLYGPSYVSCDYALSFYNIIPERVELITSLTLGRPRQFNTPVGNYLYYQHHGMDYSIGIEPYDVNGYGFLIASREKAIYDKALIDKRFTGQEIETYLLDDLRMEEESLQNLNKSVLQELMNAARGKMIPLVKFLLEQ